MEITISGQDKKRLKLIEKLAEELGLDISSQVIKEKDTLDKKRQKKAIEAMEKLAEIGAFKDIIDPVAWQREQRKDRDIGRDE